MLTLLYLNAVALYVSVQACVMWIEEVTSARNCNLYDIPKIPLPSIHSFPH